MIKRQYNNDVFKIEDYLITVERLGYTAAGKSRYRVGLIKTTETHYPHEAVYTTTTHDSPKEAAENVFNYYCEWIDGRRPER